MANVFLTSAQLTTINDRNAVDYGASDLFDDAPFLSVAAAEVASDGIIHKYLKQTGTAGAGFRAINGGLNNTVSTDTEVTVNLGILDASFAVDKAAADSYVKGPEAYIQREARRKLRAMMFAAECQIIGGNAQYNASGFTGFADSITASGNAYAVNAGGTTAATASSVWLVRTNDLGRDMEVVLGQNGSIKVDQTITVPYDDGTATNKTFPAYYTPMVARMGVQLGAVYSVVRICNLTADSGKGLTDALITKALALFPASRQPNLILSGRRSVAQLQASRTSYNPTGAPAEIPNQAFNIPIVITDAIGVTEALI